MLYLGPAYAGYWHDFCERHIVAEDPYQYLDLDVDTLIRVYFNQKNQRPPFVSKVLRQTMIRKMQDQSISRDEREMLRAALNN